MKQYMIEADLPHIFSHKLMSLMPEQRKHINKLMLEGLISHYVLSVDRSRLWLLANAYNEVGVVRLLSTFPIIDYIDFEMHEIAVNKIANSFSMAVSLN